MAHSDRSKLTHLPECESIPYNRVLAEQGQEPMPQFNGMAMMRCVDGCPRLEAAKARGVELAERFGWKSA